MRFFRCRSRAAKRLDLVIALLMLSFFITGCGRRQARTPLSAPVAIGYSEIGIASWYGPPYHGRASASGEIYDMEKMTAAHQRLPFGVITRVTNLSNQKSVEVRINDRGPFVRGRILDLSRAAASQLDMIRDGTARIRLEVVRLADTARQGRVALQAGAFRDRDRADSLVSQLVRDSCPQPRVLASTDSNGVSLYKVLVGEAERAADLEPHRRCLGADASRALLIRLDN